MTIKAEFIGGPTVLRCFISVFKYLHANFAILLKMTELEVDNSESASKCLAEESPRAAFGRLGKKVISFLDKNCKVTLLTRDKKQLKIKTDYLSYVSDMLFCLRY